jgi:non-specific serine/threonine protein kinase
LILDESQYIKNKNSKIFQAINQIKTNQNFWVVRYRKLIRRFVVSNAIYQSEYFGSYAFFAEHYKVPIEKTRRNQSAGTQNLVSPFILRRKNKF